MGKLCFYVNYYYFCNHLLNITRYHQKLCYIILFIP